MGNKPPQPVKESEGSVGDGHLAVSERSVEVWCEQKTSKADDLVATETAVALVYNGISHVVMMASPIDLESFALGFSLSEGIVSGAEDIYQTVVAVLDQGIEVSLTISNQCFTKLKDRRRNLSGRTGCGLCGAESLQQVRLPIATVVADFTVPHDAIAIAIRALPEHQTLQALTGALHGAAWCDIAGNILQVCEDIGRHNALDKLIGKLCLAGQLGQNQPGFLLISSRASYEILQKSAMVNIGFVVAISAPTSMAIDIAEQADITLVGFSRQHRHVGYANTYRLVD